MEDIKEGGLFPTSDIHWDIEGFSFLFFSLLYDSIVFVYSLICFVSSLIYLSSPSGPLCPYFD